MTHVPRTWLPLSLTKSKNEPMRSRIGSSQNAFICQAKEQELIVRESKVESKLASRERLSAVGRVTERGSTCSTHDTDRVASSVREQSHVTSKAQISHRIPLKT